MAKTQTRPWDPAEHLETEEDMAAYLSVALEEGDLGLIRRRWETSPAPAGWQWWRRRRGWAGRASTSRCQPMATLNSPPCSRW